VAKRRQRDPSTSLSAQTFMLAMHAASPAPKNVTRSIFDAIADPPAVLLFQRARELGFPSVIESCGLLRSSRWASRRVRYILSASPCPI